MIIIRRIFPIALLGLMTFGLALKLLSEQPSSMDVNEISIQVMKGMLSAPVYLVKVKPELAEMATRDCHLNWMLGLVSDRLRDESAKLVAWQRLLDCSKADINLLVLKSADDEQSTRLIIENRPTDPAALFSLADMVKEKNPAEAIALFEKAASYRPADGLTWCRLAHLYEDDKQVEKAANAFLNCCRNGDPGVGGCWGAGRMMEKLGNPGKAIEYYRLSSWQTALDRANELEKQLQP